MNRNEQLFDFIKSSPSCFHAIKNVSDALEKSGAKQLSEFQKWNVKRGETCFVTRNGSSLVAVRIPEEIDGGFMVTASHSDSPTFKIKDKPELKYRALRRNDPRFVVRSPAIDRRKAVDPL